MVIDVLHPWMTNDELQINELSIFLMNRKIYIHLMTCFGVVQDVICDNYVHI
jgi:hypothetical protein